MLKCVILHFIFSILDWILQSFFPDVYHTEAAFKVIHEQMFIGFTTVYKRFDSVNLVFNHSEKRIFIKVYNI